MRRSAFCITFAAMVALCSAACTTFAADNAVICFPIPVGEGLLKVVEKTLPDCQAGAKACDETLEAEELRIEELRDQRDECAATAEKTAKAGEQAVGAVTGSWWDRFKGRVKTFAVDAGITLGIVGVIILAL